MNHTRGLEEQTATTGGILQVASTEQSTPATQRPTTKEITCT